MKIKPTLILTCLLSSAPIFADHRSEKAASPMQADEDIYYGEDIVITSGHKLFPNTTVATPSFSITREEIDKTNLISAEDAIKMAPSVQVRRRFYADTNGVTAIRGSNNFQTNHFNLYVDGIPLHNPVQTLWNGAPKWNLIAPNAIDSATVFYGPYSAEHRGAFGGTFDLKTRLPDDFEMSVDITGIIQDSNLFGVKEVLTGHKEFISAGNRFGDWTAFAFFNHLENQGQAQSIASSSTAPDPTNSTGAYRERTVDGGTTFILGDRGLNENFTDLYELKVSYDFNSDLRALFTIAFEDTQRLSKGRSYLKDANGDTVFNPLDGAGNSLLRRGATRDADNARQTLAYALNLSGKLSENWDIDTTVSLFDAFKDTTITHDFSRDDPRFITDKGGDLRDVEVYWVDYSLKLATQNLFGRDDLGFLAGYQFNHSFLDIDRYTINTNGNITGTLEDADGGSTQIHSLFSQADWDFIDNWSIMAGFRYDHWQATRGHVNDTPSNDGSLPDRDASRVSPKVSLSFTPRDDISLRYSFSKAYRFAVAEELFNSSSSVNIENISDPNLAPESGYFHDFKIRYDLEQGYASLAFFYNKIEDEIQRTTILLNNGNERRQTQGIDKTETIGIEFVYQQDYIMDLPVGLSLNATWLNKEIKENARNPSLEGNEWTRVPKWRVNSTFTYHTMPDWDNIIAVQYRSNQFVREDNSDNNDNVFGSSSSYVLVNLKSSYTKDIGNGIKAKFSVGIDNLLDEEYYDFHPYPQRTYFANIGFDI